MTSVGQRGSEDGVGAAIFKSLVDTLSGPLRTPLDVAEIDNFHPVFELAEHFRGRDNYEAPGYTGNPYSGDHISIPAWQVKEEVEDFYVLETSYHRGKAISELVNYPDAHHAVRAAIIAVIKSIQLGNR